MWLRSDAGMTEPGLGRGGRFFDRRGLGRSRSRARHRPVSYLPTLRGLMLAYAPTATNASPQVSLDAATAFRPGGEVHSWTKGTNQTFRGLAERALPFTPRALPARRLGRHPSRVRATCRRGQTRLPTVHCRRPPAPARTPRGAGRQTGTRRQGVAAAEPPVGIGRRPPDTMRAGMFPILSAGYLDATREQGCGVDGGLGGSGAAAAGV